ncbi:MAG TPA: hypothetical protein VGJ60_26330 [Chloroflexota bacterium]|jgi:hypothetical protein
MQWRGRRWDEAASETVLLDQHLIVGPSIFTDPRSISIALEQQRSPAHR